MHAPRQGRSASRLAASVDGPPPDVFGFEQDAASDDDDEEPPFEAASVYDDDGDYSEHSPAAVAPHLADAIIWREYMEINVEGMRPESSETDADNTGAAGVVTRSASLPKLPGLPKASTRRGASEFFGGETLPLRPDPGPQSEWDLRAGMEKRRRQERERVAWLAAKERSLGRYSCAGADWRTDVRIKDTGDPTQPRYREWSLREIWDLVVLDGVATDPRMVPHRVHQPGAPTDFVAEGFSHKPEIPEWLAAQGKLLDDDDVAEVADRDAEMALLASEFSDFDDSFASSADAAEPEDGLSGEF